MMPRTISPRPRAPVFPDLPPPATAIEAYRILALRVESWLRERTSPPAALTMTSAEGGSGKTLTSLNLAVALASLKMSNPKFSATICGFQH